MLELWSEDQGLLASTAVDTSPFRVGRAPEAELQLSGASVSKLHAAVEKDEHAFALVDLGSRNGTYLNGERIEGRQTLRSGDVIRIGGMELRFVLRRRRRPNSTIAEHSAFDAEGSDLSHLGPMLQALQGKGLRPVFQSLWSIEGTEIIGYEALSWSDQLDRFPFELMESAERNDRAAQLSRTMRQLSLAAAESLPPTGRLLFLNVHPDETRELEEHLPDLLAQVPAGRKAVLEIHETAVVEDPAVIRQLRDTLHARGALLAYDDVGAGQSRLREIAECPPDMVKLDQAMIRGIDGSAARQQLVEALVRASHGLGCRLVAEGVETEAELHICGELGIDIAQGFLLARPKPAAS